MGRTTALSAVTDVLTTVTELLWPQACLGCQAAAGPLCRACAAALPAPECRRHLATVAGGLPVWSAGPYAGLLRTLVVAYKEHQRRGLRGDLAAVLAAAIRACLSEGPAAGGGAPAHVVAVPTSPSAIRRRGGDPIADLVRAACREPAPAERLTGALVLCGAVRAHRARPDQVGTSAAQRRRNLAGALRADPASIERAGCRGRPHVVVDDVVTSGASAAAVAAILAGARAPLSGVACLADAPLSRRLR